MASPWWKCSRNVSDFPEAFDAGNPRKGGTFALIDERKRDNSPEDETRHDVTDELAAYRLASLPFPGVFGVFFEIDRPTKNALENKWIGERGRRPAHSVPGTPPRDIRSDEVGARLLRPRVVLRLGALRR